MSSTNSIWATFTINGLFCVVLMVLFEYYRTKILDIYAPRSRGTNPKFERPREGYFQWIFQLSKISDDEMYKIAGLDGYVFLRFLKFCCLLCSIASVAGALILIPVYCTATGVNNLGGIELASMANVAPQGTRLWVPCIFAYLFTFLFLYLIHKEYENFVWARRKFHHGQEEIIPIQSKYTVLVENIPPALRTPDKLLDAFEAVFPGEVSCVHIVVATPELDAVVKERNHVRDLLEREIALYEGTGRLERPLVNVAKFARRYTSYGGVKDVDGINYLTQRLEKLCSKLRTMQYEVNERSNSESLRRNPDSFANYVGTHFSDVSKHSTEASEDHTSPPAATSTVSNNAFSGNTQAPPFPLLGAFGTGGSLLVDKLSGSRGARRSPPIVSPQSSDLLVPEEERKDSDDEEYIMTGLHRSNERFVDESDEPTPAEGVVELRRMPALIAREHISQSGAPPRNPCAQLPSQQTPHEVFNPLNLGDVDAGMPPSRRASRQSFSAFLEDVQEMVTSHFLSTTAFVTFKSRRTHMIATKSTILFEQYPVLTVAQAPPPADVIWANMTTSSQVTEETAFFTAASYYASITFWGGVMAIVAAMSSLSTLQKYLPFIKDFGVVAYSIIQGILPVIVVLVFSSLVAGIISAIATYVEKRKTYSSVEREVFKWYFMYQIVNIYLILVAGSVWESIVRAVERPQAIVVYLSAALPSVSTFFVNYLITVTLSGVPYKLIRRWRALQYLLYVYSIPAKFMTRRMLKEGGPFHDTRVEYGTELADVLYVLCIVLLYWVISPVVLLCATPLFWGWYFNWKYRYCFVVTKVFESGGQFWYRLYKYSMIGLLAGNIAFLTYMGIKQGIAQGPLLLPLPIAIITCWYYTERCFKNQSQIMPYDLAIRDDLLKHKQSEDVFIKFTADFMKQPNLSTPPDIFPYPYRVDGAPLLNEDGSFNDVYVEDLAEPVNINNV